MCAARKVTEYQNHHQTFVTEVKYEITDSVSLPTDRRVGEESLEQPWLRGMRLRLFLSPLEPASTLWAPELMVLRAVVVSTRPGEPLRLPAAERGGRNTKTGRKSNKSLTRANKGNSTVEAANKRNRSPFNVRILFLKGFLDMYTNNCFSYLVSKPFSVETYITYINTLS